MFLAISIAIGVCLGAAAQSPRDRAMDLGYCILDGFDKALCQGPVPGEHVYEIPEAERRAAGMSAADDVNAVRIGQCVLEGKHPDEWCRAH
jgi:hypothetical protein